MGNSYLIAIVQTQFIEHSSAGLLSNVLVNHIGAELVQADRVRERLTATLKTEKRESPHQNGVLI